MIAFRLLYAENVTDLQIGLQGFDMHFDMRNLFKSRMFFLSAERFLCLWNEDEKKKKKKEDEKHMFIYRLKNDLIKIKEKQI